MIHLWAIFFNPVPVLPRSETQCGPGDMQHIAAQNVTLDSDHLTSFKSRLFQLLELCTQYYACLAKMDSSMPTTREAETPHTFLFAFRNLQLLVSQACQDMNPSPLTHFSFSFQKLDTPINHVS